MTWVTFRRWWSGDVRISRIVVVGTTHDVHSEPIIRCVFGEDVWCWDRRSCRFCFWNFMTKRKSNNLPQRTIENICWWASAVHWLVGNSYLCRGNFIIHLFNITKPLCRTWRSQSMITCHLIKCPLQNIGRFHIQILLIRNKPFPYEKFFRREFFAWLMGWQNIARVLMMNETCMNAMHLLHNCEPHNTVLYVAIFLDPFLPASATTSICSSCGGG